MKPYYFIFVFVLLLIFGALESTAQDFTEDEATSIPFFVNKTVLQELELAGEQQKKVLTLIEVINDELTDYAVRASPLVNDPERYQEEKRLLKKKILALSQQLQAVLLPHQQLRLRQLFTRHRIFSGPDRNESALLSKYLQPLKVTAKQTSTIKTLTEKQKDELREMLLRHQKEIRELTSKHQTEQVAILTPEQKEVFDKILGPSFSFRESRASAYDATKAKTGSKRKRID